VPDSVNVEAPLEADLLVTIYVSLTILPSDGLNPVTPSPKYISNLPFSTS